MDLSEENQVDHGTEEYLATIARGKAALALSGLEKLGNLAEVDLDQPDKLGLWN